MTSNHDLELLRNLILGTDKEDLEKLSKRIEDPHTRADDIAEVLATASLRANNKDPKALASALEGPISSAISTSIGNNPERLASVLFPVMMPAIRRAIADTIRQFVERIDIVVNQQFSIQSLKWRFESLRSGVPFREILLRETLLFSVEQVLLIENGSGLLMQHLDSGKEPHADSDAVSGMLWAIESFVRDSFTQDPEEGLNRVTMGDHIVYLKHGPHATLVCVVRGVATSEFLDGMDSVVNRIHSHHHKLLTPYSGNKDELEPVQPLLHECLQTEFIRPDKEKIQSTGRFLKYILLLLLVLGSGYFGYQYFQNYLEKKNVENLVAELNEQPGIVIVDAKKKEDEWLVRGLRDPASKDPTTFMAPNLLHQDQVQFELSPYLSLEPEMRLQRLRSSLSLPDSVVSELTDDTLILGGQIDLESLIHLNQLNYLPENIRFVDQSGLNPDPSKLESYLRDKLQLPSYSRMLIDSRNVTFETPLTLDKEPVVQQLQTALDGIINITSPVYGMSPEQQLKELTDHLNSVQFEFSDYASLNAESIEKLSTIADDLQEAMALGNKIDRQLAVTLTGRSTDDGEEEVNYEIRLQRARIVKRGLVDEGAPGEIIIPRSIRYSEEQVVAPEDFGRRTDMQVEILELNH